MASIKSTLVIVFACLMSFTALADSIIPKPGDQFVWSCKIKDGEKKERSTHTITYLASVNGNRIYKKQSKDSKTPTFLKHEEKSWLTGYFVSVSPKRKTTQLIKSGNLHLADSLRPRKGIKGVIERRILFTNKAKKDKLQTFKAEVSVFKPKKVKRGKSSELVVPVVTNLIPLKKGSPRKYLIHYSRDLKSPVFEKVSAGKYYSSSCWLQKKLQAKVGKKEINRALKALSGTQQF